MYIASFESAVVRTPTPLGSCIISTFSNPASVMYLDDGKKYYKELTTQTRTYEHLALCAASNPRFDSTANTIRTLITSYTVRSVFMCFTYQVS